MINKLKPYIVGVVLTGIIIGLNFLSTKLPNYQIDVTSNKLHTLSSVTKRTVKDLERIVEVKVFVTDDLPPEVKTLSKDLQIILRELNKQNPSKFKLSFLNPLKDEKIKAESVKYGIKPLQFSSIKSDKFEVQSGYLGLVMVYGDKQEVLPVAGDIGNLEYFLISGIKRLIATKIPSIAIYEEDVSTPQGNVQYLRKFLDRSYNVLGTDLDTDTPIPTDASTLIIIGRTKKIEDKGITKIKKWLESGKSLIAFLDRVEVGQNMVAKKTDKTGLEQLFEDQGMKIGQGLIVDDNSAVANFRTQNGTFVVKYPYWPQILQENINLSMPPMSGISSLSVAWASPIELTSDKVKILFSSSKKSEVDDSLNDLSPISKKGLNSQSIKSFPIGAVRTDGVKMALIGDADMIKDQFVVNNQQNLAAALNLIDYFAQDSSMFLIRNKVIKSSPIKQVSDTQKLVIKVVNVMVPIAVLLAVYVTYYILRRRRHLALIDSEE